DFRTRVRVDGAYLRAGAEPDNPRSQAVASSGPTLVMNPGRQVAASHIALCRPLISHSTGRRCARARVDAAYLRGGALPTTDGAVPAGLPGPPVTVSRSA